MDARVSLATTPGSLALAARRLHDFATAYDEPVPDVTVVSTRLAELVATGATEVLVGGAAGVAVVQYRPSVWSRRDEAYLAELWVDPSARRTGLGRALLRACLERARTRGCDYLHLATTEDDVEARALYESEGLHATEGPGGPTAYHYEIDL